MRSIQNISTYLFVLVSIHVHLLKELRFRCRCQGFRGRWELEVQLVNAPLCARGRSRSRPNELNALDALVNEGVRLVESRIPGCICDLI